MKDFAELLAVLAHEMQATAKGFRLDLDTIFAAVAGVHRRCQGAYAVGDEHYHLLLKKRHFLNQDAQGLLALGESLFDKTKKELAALTAFLCSEKAAYITGQSIAVDGGWIKGLF